MRRRAAAVFTVGLFVAASAWGGYNVISDRLVARSDARVPRNPETGILLGAEPRDLGPADAPGVVLFVHGFLGGSNNFADLPERVAAAGWRARVILLPGHGTSPLDLEKTTLAELEQAVLDEVRALRQQHQTVILLGHSMGGALATRAAAREPIDGLILCAPYFGVTHRWYYGLRPETWAEIGAPAFRWVYKGNLFRQVNRKDDRKKILSYQWTPVRSITMLMELGRLVNEPATLKAITCPVLLVHSRIDSAASPEAAEKAVKAMSAQDKTFRWLSESNHILFWDFERDEVAQAVLEFLEARRTPSAPSGE